MVDVTSPVGERVAATSFIEWGAVFAGAVFAAALSFVLLTFGSSIGLSFVSPWPGSGASTKLVASLAVFWTMAQYILSFTVGGYIAGRMRKPWAEATPDEVEFRDGLHGGLVWALGIILGAALVLTTAGALARAGTEVAARTATAAIQSSDPIAYVTDVMLRSTAPRAATEGEQSTSPATAPGLRAEIGRILTRAIANGDLSQADKSYLASVVSQRTGVAQQEAERRVSDAFDDARRTAMETADKARRAAIVTGLVTAISLLVGLGAAWWAAIQGGRHREQAIPARFVFRR